MDTRSWKDIAAEAFTHTTGLVVRADNLNQIKIPADCQEAFCKEVSRQAGLSFVGVRECLISGRLADFIFELSKADG